MGENNKWDEQTNIYIYGKWIMDEGTWSEFVPQAEGENQRKMKQAERKIIVDKYGQ